MPTVKLPGGETIWYKTTGSGAPFLQIHGSAFGHKNFARMTPLMAEHFEVIDFDLPGYGESRGTCQDAEREASLAGGHGYTPVTVVVHQNVMLYDSLLCVA